MTFAIALVYPPYTAHFPSGRAGLGGEPSVKYRPWRNQTRQVAPACHDHPTGTNTSYVGSLLPSTAPYPYQTSLPKVPVKSPVSGQGGFLGRAPRQDASQGHVSPPPGWEFGAAGVMAWSVYKAWGSADTVTRDLRDQNTFTEGTTPRVMGRKKKQGNHGPTGSPQPKVPPIEAPSSYPKRGGRSGCSPAKFKHISQRRKRNQSRFPQ